MIDVRCQDKGLTWRVEWYEEGRTAPGREPPVRLVVRGDEGKLRQVFDESPGPMR